MAIVISEAAVEKLLADPYVQQWREGVSRRMPLLSYYQRCFSTAHDGTITEHGDGFGLTFLHLDDPAAEERSFEKISVAVDVDILVERAPSADFSIGYVRPKFTYEPMVPR